MREEVETFLFHFTTYLQETFGIIIWDIFDQEYEEETKELTNCPLKKCTIEVSLSSRVSCGSSIATNNSDNYLNIMITKYGLHEHIGLSCEEECLKWHP